MSRIGRKPIEIPSGVKVEVTASEVKANGAKGALAMKIPPRVSVKVDGGQVLVERPDDDAESRAMHGLTRALVANLVEGVATGYSRSLELYGTGYGCDVKNNKLLLNCGFMGRGVGKAAQFEIPIPEGLSVKVDTPTARGNNEPARFTVSGCDKQQVGQFCAEVRKLRKPEPYLGKGIRYKGEQIRRKAGKVFAGGG